MRVLLLVLFLVAIGGIGYYFIKKIIQKRKKYKMRLDLKTIPKKNSDFFYLGKIAESDTNSYLDPVMLTTHSIVAGATGGGKSISAQVIVEEALLHGVAVIVFDPTAQWSGMLRKCSDKKMLSYYSKFGLKEGDARGFKGNVRQVKNARELIDVNKYVHPGEIQIFTLNKLDPKDIDIFVANVIRQIFKSDPKESPTLKLLLVFDEVHRLLSKFGGSGEGFLQVERACREFRKWGMGVMLVSQVLSDFSNVYSEFFNSSFGSVDDKNSHYTNSSCTINLNFGNWKGVEDTNYTALANCTYNVWYYANPGAWNCTVIVNDTYNWNDTGSDDINISELLAIGLPDSITYGIVNSTYVSEEKIANVTNFGNVLVDIALSGYAVSEGDNLSMNCTLGSVKNISIQYEKYDVNESTPGIMSLTEMENNYTNLTSSPVVKEFNLNYRQDDIINEAVNGTYWRIYVPRGVAGNCQGNIVFGAVKSS